MNPFTTENQVVKVPASWFIFGVAALSGLVNHHISGFKRSEPGQFVDREPVQITDTSHEWDIKGFTLQSLASYDITCRLLQSKPYHSDRCSAISPMDFAVAWGKMSDQAILDKVRFGHLERYAYYGWSGDMKLSENYLATHFANMHLIPFDKAVEKDLVKVRDGEFIRMRGFLVEAHQGENFTWRSSLRRDDTENGACEVMLVKSIERI